MKRMFLIVALLAFVFPFPSTTWAQESASQPMPKPSESNLSLSISEPQLIRDMVFKIASDRKLNISSLSQISGKWDGNLVDVSVQEALKAMTADQPYTLSLEGKSIIYALKATGLAAASAPAQSATFLGLPVAADGTVTLPNGTTTSRANLEMSMRINPELVRENIRLMQVRQASTQSLVLPTFVANGQPAALPTCQPLGYNQQQSPQARPAEVSSADAYNSALMNSWNGEPFFIDLAHKDQARRLENAWNTALIKVKGEPYGKNEKFLDKVSVVALVYDSRGCQHQINIIDAGLANNWYEHDVTVPIGADQMVKLIFVREDGSENPQAFGRDQWLQPRAVEKHAKQITVHEEKLKNARDHYDLKRHVFQEDVNGEIKTVSK